MVKREPIKVFLFAGYLPSYEVISGLVKADVKLVGALFGSTRVRRLGWRQRVRNLFRRRSFMEPAVLLAKHGASVHFVDDYNGPQAEAILRGAQPDVLLLYGSRIIKPNILSIPKIGTLNAHSSLLPKYRGSASEFWMLRNNEPQYAGVTIHWVTPGLDEGDIFLQRPLTVMTGVAPRTLREQSRPLAGAMFAEAIHSIEDGRIIRIPQNGSLASTYKRPTAEDIRVFEETYGR